MRLMNWSIMPFNRSLPENDIRYKETWRRVDKSTAVTTLHLTKIDEIILGQSFKAVAYVTPKNLNAISGVVHLIRESASNETVSVVNFVYFVYFCAEAYAFTAVQERRLSGKIRLKATVVQGNLPVSLTLYNNTTKQPFTLLKVTSKPDVYVTLPVIDSLKHSNAIQFTFVAENAVRIDTIKVNVVLRSTSTNFGK